MVRTDLFSSNKVSIRHRSSPGVQWAVSTALVDWLDQTGPILEAMAGNMMYNIVFTVKSRLLMGS
jgi:hypothetical protein